MLKIFKFIKGKSLIFAIISVILTTGGCVCDLYQPTLLQDVIDAATKISLGLGGWEELWTKIGMIAGLACGGLGCAVIAMIYAAKASLLATQYLRSGLYKKVLGFSFANIDKFSTGSLITRLTTDTNNFQMLTQLTLTILIRSPITFIGGLAISFTTVGWVFGLIAVGVCLLMIGVMMLFGRNVFRWFEKAEKQLDITNNIMRENILGMRVVKSFGIQEEQTTRFRKANRYYKKYRIKAQILISPIMSVITMCLQLGIFAGLMATGFLGENDPKLVGKIFSFTSLLMIVLSSVVMTIVVVVQFITAKPSIIRMQEVFNTESTIVDSKNPKHLENDYSIKFNHVNFKYSDKAKKNILSNINFEVKQGEFLGIIGGTGSGKSSLVNLIPRLYDVQAGSISLGRINVKDISLSDLREQIGVVLQENSLFQGNVRENLKYGNRNATDEELIKACENACAWDFLSKMKGKLDYPVDQRGRNFSGGQKQRLCIARALVKKPKILIMDDSTSALDLITEAKVQENIRRDYKDSTVIIVSQRVASIKNADKIIVMDNGKISGIGTHKQLVKSSETYRNIVSSQLGKEGLR